MNYNTLVDRLKEDIATGRVITIAGSGVSVAACKNQEVENCKVATWTGLLLHGVKHCKEIGVADEGDLELLTRLITSGKTDLLISAAETISHRMKYKSEGVFRGWLKNTIGKLRVADRAILDALAALPGVLATLNIDNLLEDATGWNPVTWLKTDDVQDMLKGVLSDSVLHLHGWYKEPESVVLGVGSYFTVKTHAHAAAVLNLFTIDRTILFVGCGNTVLDPNFTRLLEWGREALKDVSPRHYLLCRTSEVSDFQRKLAGAPWLIPLGYGKNYSDLIPFLHRLGSRDSVFAIRKSITHSGPSFDISIYQRSMRKRYARFKLEELDPTTHDVRPLMLTSMFIPQSARECAEFMPRVFELPKDVQHRLCEAGEMLSCNLDDEMIKEYRYSYQNQAPRPILEVVDDPAYKRIIVLGDPGSGKSTLLQYLLLQWAEKDTPDLAREPLPLLIELREYARLRQEGKTNDFLGFLHDGAVVRWHLNQTMLDSWLKNNSSLIFFDGLDEVFDPTLRREISTSIHRFADTYSHARIIVTSRIIGYQHQAWCDENFRQFMLQEFDKSQIDDFLSRWHRHAFEEPSLREMKHLSLTRAIEDSAAIRQLTGNPLLLAMIAILGRTYDLPRDRAELYEQCARLLLHQWKVDVAFASDSELAKASLDFKDKRNLLQRIARAMQDNDQGLTANLINEEMLEITLAEGLKGIPNLRPNRSARALISQLRDRNFMICAAGGGMYAFVHRTFLEYFCAIDIRERFQTEQSISLNQLKTEVFGHWIDETWHEVLSLLAGMLAPHFVKEILEWLLDQRDSSGTCNNVFLAARCVGEIRKRGELGPLVDEIKKQVMALSEFDFHYEYYWWKKESQISSAIRSRAVSTVATVWHDLGETQPWLKDCVQNSVRPEVKAKAVQELIRGWKNHSATLTWLKAIVQSDEHGIVRMTAIQELARGWKNYPDTLIMLKTCINPEEYEDVRITAIQELARGWKNDPDTLIMLKVCIIPEEYEDVRITAIQELSRGWKNDPDTLIMLKACINHEKYKDVRKTAIQELARGWKNDPDTLVALRTCAQSDSNEDVRNIAVKELAFGWKNHPETLTILKKCLSVEKYEKVLESLLQELARGWKNDPEILSILKALASSKHYMRETAMQELARGWKDDPETLTLISALAQSDKDKFMRCSALFELANGWGDNPETLKYVKLCAQEDQNEFVRSHAAVILVRNWKNDPDTLTLLKKMAQNDDAGYVRQNAVLTLTHSWKDEPDTLTIFKERAQDDKCATVRIASAITLARAWKNDCGTLALLKALAQADEDGAVQRTAVQELAGGWKNDPEVLLILKMLAKTDRDNFTRRTVVKAVASGWKSLPNTLPWLKKLAQTDEDNEVRQTAIEEIVYGWKNLPDTLSWLKERAQTDKHEFVRFAAIELVSRNWRKNPDTLSWLIERAQTDKHEFVRRETTLELVKSWKRNHKTIILLKTLALTDKDQEVREMAANNLPN